MQTIEVGNPIRASDHVLLPIERTSIIHRTVEQHCWCHGSKQLIGLVVQAAFGIEAFELENGQMRISELKKLLPALDANLQRYASAHSPVDRSAGACFIMVPERLADFT